MNARRWLRTRRVGSLITLFALTLLVIPLVAAPLRAAAAPAGPGATNRAGLVVQYGEGPITTVCVAFEEDTISGDELLLRAGLDPVLSGEGAVCAIRDQGCPADECFCQCPTLSDCTYWVNFHLEDGGWVYSQFGPAMTMIQNGDVDGWVWGVGDFGSMLPPPPVTFEQICRATSARHADTQPNRHARARPPRIRSRTRDAAPRAGRAGHVGSVPAGAGRPALARRR